MNIDYSDLIAKYGFWGVALVIVLFFGGSLISSIKWSSIFSSIWTKISDKFIEIFLRTKVKKDTLKSITESDIINHDIFNYIDFWTYSKIPTFQFSSEYRSVVFKKYLTIYLKNYKSELFTFIQSGEYKEMDQSQIWRSSINLINKIVSNYEAEMKENRIPDVIILKMKTKNNDTITLFLDLIEGVCNSSFYTSDKNYLKIYSILNILLSILENTITNSEGVCNNINGQLKGLKFIDVNNVEYIEP